MAIAGAGWFASRSRAQNPAYRPSGITSCIDIVALRHPLVGVLPQVFVTRTNKEHEVAAMTSEASSSTRISVLRGISESVVNAP